MTWAVMMAVLAGFAVAGVVTTIAVVQAADCEQEYFSALIRLWVLVALVGSLITAAWIPVFAMGYVAGDAPALLVVASSVPGFVAVVGCLANARSLLGAQRRRAVALARGQDIEAVVVEREHGLFTLLSVTLEANLPPSPPKTGFEGGYRQAVVDPRPRLRRFVETCPGDQWARLAPGTKVRLRVDPADASCYAVVLFCGA